MQKTIVVCDTCEDPRREVTEYTVEGGGKKVKVALCKTHGRALDVVLGVAKPAGRPRGKRQAKTMAQIAAEKKK